MVVRRLDLAMVLIVLTTGLTMGYLSIHDFGRSGTDTHKSGLQAKRRAVLTGTGEVLAWNTKGTVLASNSGDQISQSAILWDVATGKHQAVLSGHQAQIYGLAWSPDGKTLATGSWDSTAAVWDATTGMRIVTLRGHTGKIFDVAWSPDGRTIATGADDNQVILWDARSGQARSTLKGHSTRVVDVRWSPDGKTLASGSDDSTLLWDLVSGKPRATLAGMWPRWSSDGRKLATVVGNTAILWDSGTGKELAKLAGHANEIRCLAWSPEGTTLATGSGDAGGFWRGLIPDRLLGSGSSAILWDASTFKARAVLTGHRHLIESLSWSPDGRYLATGSWDKSVIIWEERTGRRTISLTEGFDEVIITVSWSPDGKVLATTFGSFRTSTVLWEMIPSKTTVK